jgi:HEPN domain-containing protein
MSANRRPPDDPLEWVNRARSNLLQAQARQEGVYLEDLCFLAQQAAEKAIKAVLIHLGVEFPYTHDLTSLIALAVGAGLSVSEAVAQAARITRFAVLARYPGLAEPVTEEEYERAIAIAKEVVEWAQQAVSEQ